MLRVSQLTYQYGAYAVFSDLEFELAANTSTMLIGRNGSGKSTLLRCLAGWTMPEKGLIEIDNIAIDKRETDFRKQIILVPDTPDFYDELTAWEHLQFIAQLHRVQDWQTKAHELLENFDLSDHQNDFPFTFSRGMAYKLALSMALLISPPLLLLDEPFGPLDSVSSNFLWETLQDYRQHGHSVFFSSHVLENGKKPDQFLLLKQGQIQIVAADHIENMGELISGS